MNDNIITVDNVSKSFGGVKANIGITLSVKKGSITGIIGPNGCGKTTLFNSIVGYHPIDNGSIKFDGQEISHLLVGDIARLGMLRTFQQTKIYSKMNCVENIEKTPKMVFLRVEKAKSRIVQKTYLILLAFFQKEI